MTAAHVQPCVGTQPLFDLTATANATSKDRHKGPWWLRLMKLCIHQRLLQAHPAETAATPQSSSASKSFVTYTASRRPRIEAFPQRYESAGAMPIDSILHSMCKMQIRLTVTPLSGQQTCYFACYILFVVRFE